MKNDATRLVTAVLALGLLGGSAALAQPLEGLPRSGSAGWGDWTFKWDVGCFEEGLELWDVRFKGMKVLHKASMPVVRVKYRGTSQDILDGCGPYTDKLDWDVDVMSNGIKKRDETGTKVVSRNFDDEVLELAVFAEIGGYDLWQGWYFHKDGRMEARLYSSGWSCGGDEHENDHRHHAYWRLDFDVDGADNEIWEIRTKTSGDVTMTKRGTEANVTRTSDESEVAWIIRRSGSARHVLVRQPGNERRDGTGGPWFGLSNKDAAWRRYHKSEDVGWEFDCDEHLGYHNSESTNGTTDVVFWAASHMTHLWSQADVDNPVWHSAGIVIDVGDILPVDAKMDPTRPAGAMSADGQKIHVTERVTGGSNHFRRLESANGGGLWTINHETAQIGPGTFLTGPASTVSADGDKLHAFGLGIDKRIWRAFSPNGGASWSLAWAPIGEGVFKSGPAAAVSADGSKLHVFGLGNDNKIWRAFSPDGGANWPVAWVPIGEGVFKSGPAAAISADGNKVHVFGLGNDNRIWRAFSSNGGASWSVAWSSIGEGIFKSGPAAAVSADGNKLHVFGLGNDNRLWRAFSSTGGSSWALAWAAIGQGVFSSGPAAVVSANGNRLHVFGRGREPPPPPPGTFPDPEEPRIWRAFSPDGGASWSVAWVPIKPASSGPPPH